MQKEVIITSAIDFKILFKSLPGLYLILSPDLRVLAASDSFLQTHRLTCTQISGLHISVIFPILHNEAGIKAYKALQTSLDYVIKHKQAHSLDQVQYDVHDSGIKDDSNEINYWSITNTPVLDDTQAISYIIHEVKDITQLVIAEQLNRKTFDGFRSMTQAWGGVIWESDIQTDNLTWSQAYTDLFGYTELNSTTQEWEKLVHPDDLLQTLESLKKVTDAKSKFWTAEYRYRKADGTYTQILDNGYIFYDAQQTPVRMLGSLIDITHQKKQERKLQESIERFERVAMATNDVIWDWDLVNETLWWNEGFKELFGYEDAFLKQNPGVESWTNQIHPDDFEKVNNTIHHVIAHSDSWESEYRFRCADGTYKLIQDRGYVIRNTAGEPVRMVGAMIDITAQREIEKQLQESVRQTKEVLESLPLMTWTATPDGMVDYYSSRWFEYTGLQIDELNGWGWQRIIHPDDWEFTRSHWLESISTGKAFAGENRWLNKNGEYRWFLVRAIPIHDTEGNIAMWVGSHTDIEEQKQMMLALDESNSKFMMLAESIPHIVWSADPDGNVDYFNQQWYDYTKMTVEETLGFGWGPALHPDDLKPTIDDWLNSIATGEKYERELRLRDIYTEDYRWHLARALPHRNAEGEIVKWFGTATYINEQKLLREKLEDSEKKFRFLAESVPQMIWTSTPDGYIDYYNKRWIEYTGLTLEESLGTAAWNQVVHPDDQQRSTTRWQHSLRTGDYYEIEYRFKSGYNGTYRWFLGQGIPMYDEHGNIEKWFGTCTDIEDHKKAEEELVEKNFELERTNKDLDSFVYTASHDLKLPILNMAGLFDELTRVAEFQDPDAPKMISMFNNSLQQIQNTINDLSDVVKVQKSGKRELEHLRFQDVMKDVLVSLQHLVNDSEATITTDFSEAPDVYFTKSGLKSILYNLLSNAIKYKAANRAPKITISTKLIDNFVELKITDNGIGLDLDRHKNKLFQMFKRFHNHVNGSGLGLYIVNRLLTNHGGYIHVESQLDQGTSFYLNFKQEKA